MLLRFPETCQQEIGWIQVAGEKRQKRRGFFSWGSFPALLVVILMLMEDILHQLIGSLCLYVQGFFTSQVVQDFFHQLNDIEIATQ